MAFFDDGFAKANQDALRLKMARARVIALGEARKKVVQAVNANQASAFGSIVDSKGGLSLSIDGVRASEEDKLAAIDKAIQAEWDGLKSK